VSLEKREAGLSGPTSRTTKYLREESVAGELPEQRKLRESLTRHHAAPEVRELSDDEQSELEGLTAEQAKEIQFGAKKVRGRIPGAEAHAPRSDDFRYPNPPWQEITHYQVHSADFHENEREGQAWQLDLDAISERLDAGWRLCADPYCEGFSTKHALYCARHAERPGSDEPMPDGSVEDYWPQSETVSRVSRGPRTKGLRGDALDRGLNSLPFALSDLRASIDARGLRTPEQELIVGVFRIWVAEDEPNAKELASKLGCGKRTIDTYRKEGKELLDQLEQRLTKKIEQEADHQLMRFLLALGIDPVAEAEQITTDEELAA